MSTVWWPYEPLNCIKCKKWTKRTSFCWAQPLWRICHCISGPLSGGTSPMTRRRIWASRLMMMESSGMLTCTPYVMLFKHNTLSVLKSNTCGIFWSKWVDDFLTSWALIKPEHWVFSLSVLKSHNDHFGIFLIQLYCMIICITVLLLL